LSALVLVGLIVVSALTCPILMLIGRRRRSNMLCCPPIRTEDPGELRRRQIALSDEINRRSERTAVEEPADSSPA
jgi:hypothetical protein